MTNPALRFVRSVWQSFLENSGLEPRLLEKVPKPKPPYSQTRGYLGALRDKLKVTYAEPGKVNFELQIEKQHTNRLGILHGGTIASMVDLGGSLAVASRGLFSTGVSTDLNVTYLASGGVIGEIIRAETSCDRIGKTLAYTSIIFRNEKNELVARGSHTKYIAHALKDAKNIIDQLAPLPVSPPTPAANSADKNAS